MRVGQIGRTGLGWIALIGAMLLVSACQTPAALDTSSSSGKEIKKASVQPAAPIRSDEANAFIGLGDAELSRTLGQPKQVRRDEPAEIWQYYGADCVVDFYLYAGEAGGLAVAYMEARNQAAEATPADRCVQSLMQSVSAEPQQKML
jgi:hypothetical protein